MSTAASSAAVTTAIAAQIEATKALGVVILLEPDAFLDILERAEAPLVVRAEGGIFTKNFQYLVSYKGLAFYTKSNEKLPMPLKAEIVGANRIWVPNM